MRRRLCWDLLVNGDARKRGVIEHWCAGASCCPGGRTELVAKLVGPCGILGLLRPPPAVFPRKSWAGQAEVTSHCLLLEFRGGAVSRNFHSVVKQAEARAAKAGAARAAAAEAAAALQGDETRNRQIMERIPAGRWGDPADIGGAAVFLASSASDYVQGHILAVDGGWLAR